MRNSIAHPRFAPLRITEEDHSELQSLRREGEEKERRENGGRPIGNVPRNWDEICSRHLRSICRQNPARYNTQIITLREKINERLDALITEEERTLSEIARRRQEYLNELALLPALDDLGQPEVSLLREVMAAHAPGPERRQGLPRLPVATWQPSQP
jgi:hypothetical protein